jgi:hypothetical protein
VEEDCALEEDELDDEDVDGAAKAASNVEGEDSNPKEGVPRWWEGMELANGFFVDDMFGVFRVDEMVLELMIEYHKQKMK